MIYLDSLNFVPLLEKKNENNKEDNNSSYQFVPYCKSSPMRNVYRHINNAKYVRFIEDLSTSDK